MPIYVFFGILCGAVAEWIRRSLRTLRALRRTHARVHVRTPSAARTGLTQPDTFGGTANRVPASGGVKAGTSPLSVGR